MSESERQAASEEVSKLIDRTLQALTTAKSSMTPADGEPGSRILFPNGIELLYFKIAIGKEIDVTIAIAGEKAKYPGSTVSERSLAAGSDSQSAAT